MTDTPLAPAPLRPDLKSEWTLDERITFLNHGSFGAVPRCVQAEQDRWRDLIEAEPVEMIARRMPHLLAAAREKVGAWLGMRAADFGFVTNATEGVNAVLQSRRLREGDELVTTTHVYHAVRQAMRYVAGRAGAVCREVDISVPLQSAEQAIAKIVSALSPRTRLLIIDHITSPTALLFPVEAIVAECRRRGVDVLIDGAHAPGMLPLNVSAIGAAYYAGNLHKWTCAPRGSAFLWVRPDRQDPVHPLIVSHYFNEGFAREFEWQGTRDFSAWLSIPKAIEFFAELGWEKVLRHNHLLAAWAQEMLCRRWGVEQIGPPDGSMGSAMCTVPLPPPLDHLTQQQSDDLQRKLYFDHHIEVPVVRWADRSYIRPSCQVYNTPVEYERLEEAVREEGRMGRAGE